jgi:tetratricopeptide (TPR) repeat protein
MKALLKIKSFGSIILIILTLSLKTSAQDVKVDLNTKEKLGLGLQYYNQGNFSASKEEFTLYLKSKEKEFDRYSNDIIEAEFYVIMCDFYLNPLRTRVSIDRFISIYPTNIKTQILINKVGDYFYKAGYFRDAIEYLELKKELKTPADNFKLAISYYKIEDNAKALQLFEVLQDEKTDANIALISGYYSTVLNFSQKKYNFSYKRLISIDDSPDKIENLPISEDAWSQIKYNIPKLIVTSFFSQGESKYDSLLTYIEPKLYNNSLSFDKKDVAKLVGDIQFQKEFYDKSAKSYNIYNQLNNGILIGIEKNIYKEAFALYKSKNYAKSIDKFNEFLNLSKSDSLNQVALFLSANSYYQLKNYSKALEYSQNVINKNLDSKLNEEASFQILICYQFFADLNKNLDLCESFIKLYPETNHKEELIMLVSSAITKLKNIDRAKDLLVINQFKNDKIYLAYKQLALKLYKNESTSVNGQINYGLCREYLNEALKYTVIESEKVKSLYYLAKTYFDEAILIESRMPKNGDGDIDLTVIKNRDNSLNRAFGIFNNYNSSNKNIDTIDFNSDLLKLHTLYKLGLNPQKQFDLGNKLLTSKLCADQDVYNILNILYLNVKDAKSVDFHQKLLEATNNSKKINPKDVDFYDYLILKSNEKLENTKLVVSLCKDFLIKYPSSKYFSDVVYVKRKWLPEAGTEVEILVEIDRISNEILKIKNGKDNLNPSDQIAYEKLVNLRIDLYKNLYRNYGKQNEKEIIINKVFQDYELLINSNRNDENKTISIISELRSTAKELKILDKQILINSEQYKTADDLYEDWSEVANDQNVTTIDKRDILYLFLKKFPESRFKKQIIKKIAEYSVSLHDNSGAVYYYKLLFDLTSSSEKIELKYLIYTIPSILLKEKKYNEIEQFLISIDKKIPNYIGAKPIYAIANRMVESFKDSIAAIHFYKRTIEVNKSDSSLVNKSLLKLISKYKNTLTKSDLVEYLKLSKSYFKNKADLIDVYNELIDIYFEDRNYALFHESIKEMNNRVSIVKNIKNIEKYLNIFCTYDTLDNYKKMIVFISELNNNDKALDTLISESELNYIEILINEGKDEDAYKRLLVQYQGLSGNSKPNIFRSFIPYKLGYLLFADLAVKTGRRDEGKEVYNIILKSKYFNKLDKSRAEESLRLLTP